MTREQDMRLDAAERGSYLEEMLAGLPAAAAAENERRMRAFHGKRQQRAPASSYTGRRHSTGYELELDEGGEPWGVAVVPVNW